MVTPFVDPSGKVIPPMPVGVPKPNKLHLTTGISYFFKRGKNRFIAVDEKQAWSIISGKNQIIGRQIDPWEYVGRTDGSLYIKAVNEAHKILHTEGIDKYKEVLEKALNDEYKRAKKDKTPPRNFDVLGQGGIPINIQTYGN